MGGRAGAGDHRARRLGRPFARPPSGTRIGVDSIALALRSLFDSDLAGDLAAVYELRLDGTRFRVAIGGGEIELARGAAEAPDVAIEGEPGDVAALITGQVSLDVALESGAIRIEGSRREAARFLRLFPMPEPCAAGAQAGAAESGVAITV